MDNTYTLNDDILQDEATFAGGESEITPEQKAILDTLIDPDEPEDPKELPSPASDAFHNVLVGAILTDAEFLSEAAPHLRGSLFKDNGLSFLVKAAKTWREKYDTTATPPRFFIEEQIRISEAQPIILEVFDQLVNGAKPEHVKYCQAYLSEFIQTQEVRVAVAKHIDAYNKGEGDVSSFIADLQAARSIGAGADAFVDMVGVLSESTGYDWLIDDILYGGSLNVLSGAAGAGKTVFLMQVLVDLIHGAPVFGGKESHPGTVCWCDYDANGEHFRDNLRVALGGRDAELVREKFQYATLGTTKSLPQVLTPAYLDSVKRKHNPKIIVIDPLRAAFAATPKLASGWENDSGTMTTLLAPFRQWAHDNDVAVIFIHHFNRQGTISGSAAIQACSDVLWNFDRPENSTAAAVRINKRLPKTHNSTWEYIDRRYVMNNNAPTDKLEENVFATKIKLAEQIWAALPASQRTLDDIGASNKVRNVARAVVAELNQAGAIVKASHKSPYDKADEAKFNDCMVLWQAEAGKC